MERIGLREAVTALRGELGESILAAAGEELPLEVGEITLDFQIELERKATGSGGIRFWVVAVGGEASKTSAITHSVKVPLRPVSESGEPVLTGAGEVPE